MIMPMKDFPETSHNIVEYKSMATVTGGQMNLTDDQRRMLTEKLLGECWHKTSSASTEWCIKCKSWIEGPGRTFLTWQDLGDCKEALVKKGLWRKFLDYCDKQHQPKERDFFPLYDFVDWLFCLTDEGGEAHFCRLVAEFMEERK